MATPDQVRPDKVLTKLSIAYKNEKLIADEVVPSVPVDEEGARYFVHGLTGFIPRDDARAPGGRASEIPGPEYSKDTYLATNRALKTKVTAEEIAKSDSVMNAMKSRTQNLKDQILVARECRVASMLRTQSNYHTDLSATVSTNDKWGANVTGGISVVKQIAKAQLAIHKKIIDEGNSIAIPYEVVSALEGDEDLLRRIINVTRGILTPSIIADLIGIENVYVPKGMASTEAIKINSSDEQVVTLDYIWGKDVILFYRNPKPARETKSFAYQFDWKNKALPAGVRKWWDNDVSSYFVEENYYRDEKFVCVDSAGKAIGGYIFKGAID